MLGFFRNKSNNNNNNNNLNDSLNVKPLQAIKEYLVTKQRESNYQERLNHFCAALTFLIEHQNDDFIDIRALEVAVANTLLSYSRRNTSNRYVGLFNNLKENIKNAQAELAEFIAAVKSSGDPVSKAITSAIPANIATPSKVIPQNTNNREETDVNPISLTLETPLGSFTTNSTPMGLEYSPVNLTNSSSNDRATTDKNEQQEETNTMNFSLAPPSLEGLTFNSIGTEMGNTATNNSSINLDSSNDAKQEAESDSTTSFLFGLPNSSNVDFDSIFTINNKNTNSVETSTFAFPDLDQFEVITTGKIDSEITPLKTSTQTLQTGLTLLARARQMIGVAAPEDKKSIAKVIANFEQELQAATEKFLVSRLQDISKLMPSNKQILDGLRAAVLKVTEGQDIEELKADVYKTMTTIVPVQCDDFYQMYLASRAHANEVYGKDMQKKMALCASSLFAQAAEGTEAVFSSMDKAYLSLKVSSCYYDLLIAELKELSNKNNEAKVFSLIYLAFETDVVKIDESAGKNLFSDVEAGRCNKVLHFYATNHLYKKDFPAIERFSKALKATFDIISELDKFFYFKPEDFLRLASGEGSIWEQVNKIYKQNFESVITPLRKLILNYSEVFSVFSSLERAMDKTRDGSLKLGDIYLSKAELQKYKIKLEYQLTRPAKLKTVLSDMKKRVMDDGGEAMNTDANFELFCQGVSMVETHNSITNLIKSFQENQLKIEERLLGFKADKNNPRHVALQSALQSLKTMFIAHQNKTVGMSFDASTRGAYEAELEAVVSDIKECVKAIPMDTLSSKAIQDSRSLTLVKEIVTYYNDLAPKSEVIVVEEQQQQSSPVNNM